MPSFADAYDAILAELPALGPPFPPVWTNEPGIVFPVITGTLLSRMFSARQSRETWDTLNAARFDSPEVMAGKTLAELVLATRNLPVPRTPLPVKTLMPLHLLARWIVDHGGLNALDDIPTEQIRDDLLMIPGISPAMTDAVLLYGLKRPTYPADRPTYRIMARHGWIEPTTNYEEARAIIEEPAQGDVEALSNLAAWFDRTGELYCKAKAAKCENCPLQPFLPAGGPIEATAE